MLLQQLCDYADRQLALPPAGYRNQSIRYVIELDRAGRWRGIIDTSDSQQRGTRRGKEFNVPYLKRSGSKPKPVLFAELAGRTLGIPYGEKAESWCGARHREYVDLVHDCAQQMSEPEVTAVASFLERLEVSNLELPDDFETGALLTFRVDDTFPFQLLPVRDYWASLTGTSDDEPAFGCVVCGQQRPALQVHPLKIKGIHSGNPTGTDLISANKAAFESYGLERSQTAPTCYSCAWKYGNALNELLADSETHLWVGAVDYVFWTAEKTDFRPGKLLSDPDPTEVHELLDSARSGKRAATEIDDVAFLAVGLTGSGARVAVRTWIDTTVGAARDRLVRYFALQEIEDAYGAQGPPLSVRRLAGATVRDPYKDKPSPGVTDGLFELALGGRRLPEDVLFRAVQRCRAGQGVSRERAALIKMALGSEHGWSNERTEAMSGLDATNREPAYLCGRLLAVVDAVQHQAIGPKATVIDKFYGSASSAPASVFGNLLGNAQNHLSKLKNVPRTRAAGVALDGRLMDVMEGLQEFPKTFTLPEQAMFALGFYHQRAADRRAARERADERRKVEQSDAPDDQAVQ